MGCCRSILYFVAFLLILAFVPGIPPNVEFIPVSLKPVLPPEGPLTPNNFLDGGERLYENYFKGPESIAVAPNNDIYVGLQNGDIVKVWGKNFEKSRVIGNNGPPGCSTADQHHEERCGRPLGLRWLTSGHILIADAYFGIFKMDANTGKSEMIVNASLPIEGEKPFLVDDLDADHEGNIYWSDASSISSLSNAVIDLLAGPYGRLIKYNAKTKKNEVLLSKIHFANGVQLSPKQDYVLLNECFARRVVRYWLKGPKAGTSDIFSDRLPGMPDNIRISPEGTYYVSLVAPHDRQSPDLFSVLGPIPSIRRLIIRVTYLLQKGADLLGMISHSCCLKNFVYKTLSLNILSFWFDKGESAVLEIDQNGKIIDSLQGTTGQINMISETARVGDSYIFGSPYSPYLGRLKIADLAKMRQQGSQQHKKSNKKDEL